MTDIRALRKEDDLGDLIALSREFFSEYEAHHKDFFEIDELQDSDIVGYFSRWIDNEDGETFIALSDGNMVGYITVYVQTQASFYKVKKVGAISGLMVQPDQRRRGIASQLLAQARAFFEDKGVKYFTVYTATRNQAALDFYARNGMTPLHTTLVRKVGEDPDHVH